MARTKSGSGLLPLVLVVGVIAVAVFGAGKVLNTIEGFFSGSSGGTEVIGSGDAQVLIASSADSAAKQCTMAQMLGDHRCGDMVVLVVDAARMPFIGRNTKLAWEAGKPGILTMNRAKQRPNRAAACPRSFSTPHGGQCDEYPMASTDEGGSGARAEEVPARENQCQGGSYGRQYPKDGQQFLVVIASPSLIASGSFTGTDVAKIQGYC